MSITNIPLSALIIIMQYAPSNLRLIQTCRQMQTLSTEDVLVDFWSELMDEMRRRHVPRFLWTLSELVWVVNRRDTQWLEWNFDEDNQYIESDDEEAMEEFFAEIYGPNVVFSEDYALVTSDIDVSDDEIEI